MFSTGFSAGQRLYLRTTNPDDFDDETEATDDDLYPDELDESSNSLEDDEYPDDDDYDEIEDDEDEDDL